MILPSVIDIAIGLFFVYLILSLLASEIQEQIATLREWRAKQLKQAIYILLDGQGSTNSLFSYDDNNDRYKKSTTYKFYRNDLIQSLNQRDITPRRERKNSAGPSYISSETFATVLFEVIARAAIQQNKNSGNTNAVGDPQKLDEFLNIKDLKGFLEGIQKTDLPQCLKDNLSNLALRTQINKGSYSATNLKEEIQKWYERAMQRTSGVYKRNVTGLTIAVGFLLALVANADTFNIINNLPKTEDIRNIIVNFNEKLVPRYNNTGTATGENNNSNHNLDLTSSNTPDFIKLRDNANKALEGVSLPIGWSPTNLSQQFSCPSRQTEESQGWKLLNICVKEPPSSNANPLSVILKLMYIHPWRTLLLLPGWLLTGFAISMGAKFWFDLLTNFVNVRNTGRPPEPSSHSTASNAQAENRT